MSSGFILGIFADVFIKFLHMQSIGLLLVGVSGLLSILSIIMLNVLFIHKLIKVFSFKNTDTSKDSNSKKKQHIDQQLLHVITKVSLLCAISTGTHLIGTGLYIVRVSMVSPHTMFIHRFFSWGDTYTNFLSVLLSFDHFNNWYAKCCGCPDRLCHAFWRTCYNDHQDVKNLEVELNYRTPRSRSADGSHETTNGSAPTTLAVIIH